MAKGNGGTRANTGRIATRFSTIGNFNTSRIEVVQNMATDRRAMFEAYSKEPVYSWETEGERRKVVELTVDTSDIPGEVYLNRIDASEGKGYGRELVTAVLEKYRKQGFKTARAYVEWNNPDSPAMLRKMGAVENGIETSGGRFFTLDLKKLNPYKTTRK